MEMKKVLFVMLILSSSLFADAFEEENKDEIKKIIIKYINKYPDDPYMQNGLIKCDIKCLKENIEIRKKYGVTNE
jgi:hypothetical protein